MYKGERIKKGNYWIIGIRTMKSEIQKLNEDRSNAERVEQSTAILISVGLFLLTILAMGFFIECLVLPRLNP
jgi:hypothetical protein